MDPPGNSKIRQKSIFSLLLNGQIETAKFVSLSNIYCKYFYIYGSDWQQITGLNEGISSTCQKGANTQHVVLNTPLEATFISTNPFKWPQIVLCCYEHDRFGNDIIKGYGATYVPSVPGRTIRKVPIFLPQSSTTIQKIISFFTGRRAEFVDARIVATSEGRDITRVSTQGLVTINMMVVLKDIKRLGYDVQAHTSGKFLSEFPLPNFEDFNRNMNQPSTSQIIKEQENIIQKNETSQNSDEIQEIMNDNQKSTTKIQTIDEESLNEDMEKTSYD